MTGSLLLTILIGYLLAGVLARVLLEAGRIWLDKVRFERLRVRRELLAGDQELTALRAFGTEVEAGELRGMPPADPIG